MTNDHYTLGIEALQQGDLETAKAHLARVVKEDPNSADGWLWLGRCLTDKEQKTYCYKKVLRLNPQNTDAQHELDQLFLSEVTKTSLSEANFVEAANKTTTEPPAVSSKAKWKPNPIFLSILGVLLGLCICGVPLLFALNSGALDLWANYFQANKPIPTTATPFALPSLIPTVPTTTLIPSATSNPQVMVENNMWQIRNLVSQGKPAEAIPLLDMVIDAAPDVDEAYYLRALSYYRLMEHQRSQFEYEDYMYRGLEDIDKAIEIRADDGDYYMLRQNLLAQMSGLQFYRVDVERVAEYSLENAIAAINLGSTLEEYPNRIYVIDLIFANHCEEAVDETQRLIDQTDPNDSSIGGLYHIQSQAYICLGDIDNAMQMLDKSLFNNTNMEWKYGLKARYLYQAGRSDDALELLNQSIEQQPGYTGWRYYLRALIYLEKGEREKAEQDLMMGAGNTWGRAGLFPYVQGKMALEDGNREEGILLLQEAEASMDCWLTPLQKRIQGELRELGAEPLQITPSVMLEATSIPTIQARPTARVLETPTPLRPVSVNATLTPTPEISLPWVDAIVVDLATGTGKLILQPNDFPLFRFQPAEPIPVKSVVSLVIHLIPATTETRNPDIQIDPWNPRSGGWGQVDSPAWGDNIVQTPAKWVLPDGDVFLAIRNWGTATITFENVSLTLVVETQDGAIKTYGQQ